MSERTTGQVQDMPRSSLSSLMNNRLRNGIKGLINIAFRGIELSPETLVAILGRRMQTKRAEVPINLGKVRRETPNCVCTNFS